MKSKKENPSYESDTDDRLATEYKVPQKYPLHSPVVEDKGVVLIVRMKDGGWSKGVFIPRELT